MARPSRAGACQNHPPKKSARFPPKIRRQQPQALAPKTQPPARAQPRFDPSIRRHVFSAPQERGPHVSPIPTHRRPPRLHPTRRNPARPPLLRAQPRPLRPRQRTPLHRLRNRTLVRNPRHRHVPERPPRRASCLDAQCLDACSRSPTESPHHVRSHHHECRITNAECRVFPPECRAFPLTQSSPAAPQSPRAIEPAPRHCPAPSGQHAESASRKSAGSEPQTTSTSPRAATP